jgi:hypothetical protein
VSTAISVGRTIVYGRVMPWSAAYRVLRLWQRTAPRRPRRYNETLSLVCTRARPDKETESTSLVSADKTAGTSSTAIVTAAAVSSSGSSSPHVSAPFSMVEGERNVARNVVLSGVYVLGDAETDEQAKRAVRHELRGFDRFGGALTIRTSDYASTMKMLGDQRTYKPFSAIRVVMSRLPLAAAASKAVIANLDQNPTIGFHSFSAELMGGAIRDVEPGATAFVARDANFFCDLVSYWDSALDTAHNSAAVERMFHSVYRPEAGDIVYVGFPVNRLPRHLDAYYGANKARLVGTKAAVDPLNVIAFPTGIVESPRARHP